MKDDLERVLEGLARVEAPAGMEGRVLRAVDARQKARAAQRLGFAWAWVGIAALVFVGVLFGDLRHEPAKTVGFSDNRPMDEAERHTTAATVPAEKAQAVVVSARRRDSSTAFLAKGARNFAQNDGVYRAADEGSVFVSESPLTEQERLLLRLARRANGGTVAMFDPQIREERAAEETAEFEFFNPQPAVIATAEPEERPNEVLPGK